MTESYKNVFPFAQEVILEEIVGKTRIASFPPTGVELKEGNEVYKTIVQNTFTELPAWFNENKLSKYELGIDIYMRNKIIEKYRKEKRNITIKETFEEICEKNYTGTDFEIFLKTFNFCEDNKLINYGIDILTIFDIIKQLYYQDEKDISDEISNETNENNKSIIVVKKHLYYKERYIKPELLKTVKCIKCNNSAQYFSSNLNFSCVNCYKSDALINKKFHEITPELLNAIWSKHEEFYLLQGIEKYGDEWDKVMEYVNVNNKNELNVKKTKEMCIFHFINMCILETLEEYHALPFFKFQNQITAFIAFLSTIDPVLSNKVSKEFLKIMKTKETQSEVIKELIDVAKNEALNRITLKQEKIHRLKKVRLEALIKKLELKIKAIYNMNKEPSEVRKELTEKRYGLLDELSKIN